MSDRADVLVIGSGASGGIVSRHLSERGFKVVCFEQGHWVNASEFPGNRPEWELELSQRWHHDPNLRRRADDYPVEVTAGGLNRTSTISALALRTAEHIADSSSQQAVAT